MEPSRIGIFIHIQLSGRVKDIQLDISIIRQRKGFKKEMLEIIDNLLPS